MAIHGKDGVTFEGAVLAVWNDTYQIMSDVWGTAKYARVWNKEQGKPQTVVVDVCDYSWSNMATAEVDATEEVLAAYDVWEKNLQVDRLVSASKAAAERVEKGAIVEVVAGRNGKGITGKVVFEMDAVYSYGYRGVAEKKYCIATTDRVRLEQGRNGKMYDKYVDVVWAWARNVKRLDVAEVNVDEIREEVEKGYKRHIACQRW